ncbi:MAG: diguanylate cyclase [Pseudomonadota bacterium]
MAASPVIITSEQVASEYPYYEMDQALQVFEDESNQLSIEQVTSSPIIDEFYDAESAEVFAPTHTTLWVRFSIHNASERPLALQLALDWRYFKEAILYSPGPNQKYQVASPGHQYPPLYQGNVPSMDLLFDVALSPQQKTDFYLKLRPLLDFKLYSYLSLWRVEALRSEQNSQKVIHISFFAMIALMMLYNLFLFFSLRDRAYLYYVAYISALNLQILCLNGVFEVYVWPSGNEPLFYVYLAFEFLAIIFSCQFSRTFLNTHENFPRGDLALRLLILAALIFLPVVFIISPDTSEVVSNWFNVILVPTLLVAGIVVWRRGVKAARYFLVSIIMVLLSIVLSLLFDLDIITHLFFAFDFFLITSVLEAALLSFALADRINTMQSDNIRMQSELLATEKALNEELEQQVSERTEALTKANEVLEKLSNEDGLTQLYNRRYFNNSLQNEWQRLQRRHQPLSLIMLDVDHFKRFNDHYGHQAGDECLQQVAQIIKQNAKRSYDIAARYGGEEFAVILPHTEVHDAIGVAESIRSDVEQLAIPHVGSPDKDILSISLGVASIVPQGQGDGRKLVAIADAALYVSKENGRDRVSVAADNYSE